MAGRFARVLVVASALTATLGASTAYAALAGTLFPLTGRSPRLRFARRSTTRGIRYNSSDKTILATHVTMAKYAGLDAFIASWWGLGKPTDARLPLLLGRPRPNTSPWRPTTSLKAPEIPLRRRSGRPYIGSPGSPRRTATPGCALVASRSCSSTTQTTQRVLSLTDGIP